MLESGTNEFGDAAAPAEPPPAPAAAGAGLGDAAALAAAMPESGWGAVPPGEEWRLVMARAGVALDDGYTVRAVRGPFDIYDTLYRDAIHSTFPKTFSTAWRGARRD